MTYNYKSEVYVENLNIYCYFFIKFKLENLINSTIFQTKLLNFHQIYVGTDIGRIRLFLNKFDIEAV